MIDKVYTLLLFLLNKENKGYITPEEFNTLAYKIQNQILTDLFIESNKAKIRTNRGNNNIGLTNNEFTVYQRLEHLITTSSRTVEKINELKGKVTLPKDVWFLIPNGVSKDNITIEQVEQHTVNYLLSINAQSEDMPIYVLSSGQLTLYPLLTQDIDITYMRKPKKPKWTFQLVKDSPLFNPSDQLFQDFDLHESEFSNIILRMLPELGLTIREQDVIEYGEKLKENEKITEMYNQ